jgi:Flp pilus assembly pilin Flp
VIAEPITTLTDYALAAESFIFAALLWQSLPPKNYPTPYLWIAAFISVAIAATCGGTYHGFTLSPLAQWTLWRILTAALSITSACLLAVTVYELPPSPRTWGLGAIALKSTLYLSWTTFNPHFVYILLDYLSAMLLLLAIQIKIAAHSKTSSLWIIAGVLASLIAAVVQGLSLNLTEHFNHNDLYHLIQMVALFLFYKGACIVAHTSPKS